MLTHLLSFIAQTNVILPTPHTNADSATITTVLDVVYTIVGAVTFAFIVFGGFKYIISNGDPQATARAKDTIIYAAVGLVIVLSAAALTNFVIGHL